MLPKAPAWIPIPLVGWERLPGRPLASSRLICWVLQSITRPTPHSTARPTPHSTARPTPPPTLPPTGQPPPPPTALPTGQPPPPTALPTGGPIPPPIGRRVPAPT